MKSNLLIVAVAASALFPCISKGQTTGRIECARSDDYIYLYSSITTLEVRRTLQCGEVVQITGRGDNYCSVRTSKGDVGYVPTASLVLLKDEPGVNAAEAENSSVSRERISYDPRPKPVRTAKVSTVFGLAKDTAIRVRLVKTLSSGSVHAGDAVDFEVIDDVLVDKLVVIARGSKVTGTVVETAPKKRFGRDGRVSFKIMSVRLVDNEMASVRCYHEFTGDANSPGSSGPSHSLASGKDAIVPEGTAFTVLIEEDVPLKREAFTLKKNEGTSVPAASSQGPQQ